MYNAENNGMREKEREREKKQHEKGSFEREKKTTTDWEEANRKRILARAKTPRKPSHKAVRT